MGENVIYLFAAILIIGALLLLAISVSKKDGKQLDVNQYRIKWMSIEKQLVKDESSSYHLAVLNGDKLLDQALRDRGVKGETMGVRMKNSKDIFSDRNGVWQAHKLRNQIAHEADVEVSYSQARHALASFKKALKDAGAI